MICRGENGTNGCHLAIFNEDVAFASYFVANHLPLPSHPVGEVVVLAPPVKNYLKWWASRLAIHLVVGESQIINSYRFM